jgi:hypothetical protein
MSIISIILLVFAVVLLILILANVPVSQRALNILFLILVIFMIIAGAGWLNNITVR